MVDDLLIEDGKFSAVKGRAGEENFLIQGKSVIVAAGGFEANLEWLEESWGLCGSQFPRARHSVQPSAPC